MTEKAEEPVRSPLHARHRALGANFTGIPSPPNRIWTVPLDYGDPCAEHRAVRASAGVFDLTHLGQLMIKGAGTARALNRFLTNDVDQLDRPGKAQYTLACDDDGGVLGDLVLYRFTRDGFMLACNAPDWLEVGGRIDDESPESVEVRVVDGTQVFLSVQGPEAAGALERLGFPVGHDRMFFEIGPREWGHPFVNRWGFTGEDGYEVIMPADLGGPLWDALVAEGVRPSGMTARDSLRLDMGFPLCGRDVGRAINPVQARLSWAVGWGKRTFWGKDALEAVRGAGPRRRLLGLAAVGGGVPTAGAAVFDGERKVGATTSAGYSPTLENGIALALIDARLAPGAELELADAEGRLPVRVVKPPFVTAPTH